ncbi:hypothetical protein BC939DRAFT_467178 [Gamsiella multidivaricata]|uniref:uncharacterized protein n=1 Tax=Gamsiella multidivaricata TaxID=101098 RepID=UPI00221E7C76|nr:uncharacterized protein BC939DRAFT_467178 [Gamsiella multidivaricata]KAI7817027.1 hypothetical protein BC939DRAFT_467178 [Gamsiella multidivaricata]
MTMGANIIPVFEQLGLLEEFEKLSLPCLGVDFYRIDRKKLGIMDLKSRKPVTGYDSRIFARPRLYELFRKQVPANKNSLNKKVDRMEEKDGKVFIHCSDDTVYEGDILVGADGAYSGVRRSLYDQLDKMGLLPKEDPERMSIGYVTMVGVAGPQSPDKYPQLKDEFSHFSHMLRNDSSSWGVGSIADNQVCWFVSIQLSEAEAEEHQVRNSEWGPHANDTMLDLYRDKPCPWGSNMAEIFDATPKDMISKVFLEQKMFKTWFHSRTVFIGDACHKMLPGAGVGAVNALQDVVVLANCLFSMPDKPPDSINSAFKSYCQQRFHRAAMEIERSNAMSKITAGQVKHQANP